MSAWDATLRRMALAAGTVAAVAIALAGQETARLARDSRLALGPLQESAMQTLARANRATDSLERYNSALERQLLDPKTQRGIGLLLRSGDDLARLVKRGNNTLENLNSAITGTRQDAARLAAEAAGAIVAGHAGVSAVARDAGDLAAQARRTLAATEAGVRQTASGLDDTLAGLRRLTGHMDRTVLLVQPDITATSRVLRLAAMETEAVASRAEQSTRWISWIGRGFSWVGRTIARPFSGGKR